MNNENQPLQEPRASRKPDAYDTNGRPLYYQPEQPPQADSSVQSNLQSLVTEAPTSANGHNFDPALRRQYANEPDIIHARRPFEPSPITISEEVRRRHENSREEYPFLNLSQGEYVMLDVRRHPIGLLRPILMTFGVVGLIVAVVTFFIINSDTLSQLTPGIELPAMEGLFFPLALLIIIAVLGGFVAVWVYLQNRFFVTNESVIQEIQYSLFSHREQTVSLGSIEDASYIRSGLLQMIFDYGSIRLSTEGDETTYQFHYVADPKRTVAIMNNAIEAFKNGRPVDDNIFPTNSEVNEVSTHEIHDGYIEEPEPPKKEVVDGAILSTEEQRKMHLHTDEPGAAAPGRRQVDFD